ncbi:hypothetical protein OSB04_019396 [Centaurea solstitialis]|uniref:Uncharacterized protein n=1 Tax=Centaurea solstitialis TaxID=347529 RepID=A0AA38SQS4_9ASTR|nr:hypothetical protein OSB04_019396 [Centaurea solstitialis]
MAFPESGTLDEVHGRTVRFTQVWLQVMDEVNWRDFPCSWNDIVEALLNDGLAPKTLTHRLALAASRILSNVLDRVAWKHKKTNITPNAVDA